MGILLATIVLSSSAKHVSSVDFSTTCDEPTYDHLAQPETWGDKFDVKYVGWSGPKAKGNPGSFWNMKGSWDKGRVGLMGGMAEHWGFQPDATKAIDSVKFTTDMRIQNPDREAALMLTQGIKTYVAFVKPANKNSKDWQTVSKTLKESDFRALGFEPLYFHSGPMLATFESGHPSFKAGAPYINFYIAFIQIDKNAKSDADSIDYDNISISAKYSTH